jgi:hypothetical protein
VGGANDKNGQRNYNNRGKKAYDKSGQRAYNKSGRKAELSKTCNAEPTKPHCRKPFTAGPLPIKNTARAQ